MKTILLANIGNRNIQYTGNNQSVRLQGSDAPFRESTRILLENFDQESPFLTAQILPALIKNLDEPIDELIIFGSDSPPGTRNNQDTIFEAALLEKIFMRDGSTYSISIKPLPVRVVDVNLLMCFYRDFLNSLLQRNSQCRIIICDAGGTTQQKTALKIIAEYLLPRGTYRIFNVLLERGESVPEEIFSLEYRKVIDGHQTEALIRQYNYSGALLLYGPNNEGTGKIIVQLLKLSSALFSNHADDALNQLKNPPRSIRVLEPIDRLSDNDYYSQAVSHWNGVLSTDSVFKLCLLLDIAEAYHKARNWGFTILHYHIFIERFLHEVLTGVVAPNHLIKDWEIIRCRIKEGELFGGTEFIMDRNIDEIHSATFPVLWALARLLNEPRVNSILDCISDPQKGNLSGKRNKFAHEGRTLTESDVKPLQNVFSCWRIAMGLPLDRNLFDDLNNCLQNLLRK